MKQVQIRIPTVEEMPSQPISEDILRAQNYLDKIEEIRFKELLTQEEICTMIKLSYSALFRRNRLTLKQKTLKKIDAFIKLYESNYKKWLTLKR